MTAASVPTVLVGPMLRFVGEAEATVWVQTSGPCEVEVLGARSRTFTVADHHNALVCVEGLEPGETYEYEVLLDGQRVWPEPGSPWPPSRIRTLDTAARQLRIAFGSCRLVAPHEPPYALPQTQHEKGRGLDALRVYATRLAEASPQTWPNLLLLLGDQLYSDDLSPEMARVTRSERSGQGPPDELLTFSEFALAYRESWTDPPIRWLLSTIPTAMVFDDHEVRDAWKSSQAWLEELRAQGWYDDRVASALSAYWLYQHLGNLSPAELRDNSLLADVRDAQDGWSVLRDVAVQADRESGHSRWSFSRRLGSSRLVVVDSRAGRVLTPGARRMVDPGEWEWVDAQIDGAEGHLLLASSLPILLSRGQHHAEAWNEAICDGAWGSRAARIAERLRQRGRLEHWASFGRSFEAFAQLLHEVVSGRAAGLCAAAVRRRPPRLHRHSALPGPLRDPHAGLAAGVLTTADVPRAAQPPRLPVRRVSPRRPHRARARTRRPAARAATGLGPRREAELRQPDRHPRPGRPARLPQHRHHRGLGLAAPPAADGLPT